MRPEEVSGIGPDEAGKFGLGHRREIATFEIPEIKKIDNLEAAAIMNLVSFIGYFFGFECHPLSK